MKSLTQIEVTDRLVLIDVGGDVATPAEGQIWYNSELQKFRKFEAGVVTDLVPSFMRRRTKFHLGNGNGTGVGTVGWTITGIGAATTSNVATTNRYTQAAGVEYLVTVAATTAIAGWRETAAQVFFGNSAGNGGFEFYCRFGLATGVSTSTKRCFTGMTTSGAAPTDVNPSTIINMCGVGWDATDTNIQIMSNGGAGAATKIDTGIPVPTVDRRSLYELTLVVLPNSTTLYYRFADLAEGGTVFIGNTSTDTPTQNSLLAARGWMSVGGTSSVIGYKLCQAVLESRI